MAVRFAALLGQEIVVENKAGAGGMVGTELVKAIPQTLAYASPGNGGASHLNQRVCCCVAFCRRHSSQFRMFNS